MPERIQMTRSKPWRAGHPHAVKVDRSTKWGNRYRVGDPSPVTGDPMTAEEACDLFECHVVPTLPVHELAGKDLACWCRPGAPCHADVLLKYAARCAPKEGGPSDGR
jgi:hypothetical protein